MDIMIKDDNEIPFSGSSGGSSSSPTSSASYSLVNKILPMKNATVLDMVKAAENFFISMGK